MIGLLPALLAAILSQPTPEPEGAAFASLSATQRELLDIRANLSDKALACVSLGTTSSGQSRRRLQGRLADGSSLVVFARSRDATGEVTRVEFVRTRDGVQRGYTWDTDGNLTTGVDWNRDRSKATSFPVPSGGPVPLVLRSLGRRVISRCG
ncbi:MAG: hypothetical protein JNL26_10245 [Gemmatimonadetes bacterium]|nr:hypothetical protein [Gemmatimonadota bacterium]